MAEIARVKRRGRTVRRGIIGVVVIGVVVLIVFLLAGSNGKPAATGKGTGTTGTTGATGSKGTTGATGTTSTSSTSTSSTTATTTPTPIAPACPPATAAGAPKREIAFTHAPGTCISLAETYEATFDTNEGTFVVTMNPKLSEAAVNNFVFLARYHFFDGIIFHRVIPGFVVQGGDPTGTGTGGPGYSWTGNVPPSSCTKKSDCYDAGSVAMANSSGPSTNGSQFFLVLPGGAKVLNQEPNYTNFGQVTSGMSVVEKLGSFGTSGGTPKKRLYMIKVTITQIPG
jgi:cyclophilin family peptidyl-prolyl cis-trans isomerase